jgi:hypothetical protein
MLYPRVTLGLWLLLGLTTSACSGSISATAEVSTQRSTEAPDSGAPVGDQEPLDDSTTGADTSRDSGVHSVASPDGGGTGADDGDGSGGDDGDDGDDEDDTPPTVADPPPASPELPLPEALVTFFVSSSVGNDAWSGTLEDPNANGTDGPKASLDAARQLIEGSAPGTHVLLRKGDSWEAGDQLAIADAVGTEQDPIVLGSYGDGAQPEIISQHPLPTLMIRSNASRGSAYFRVHDIRLGAVAPADGSIGVYIGESFHPEVPHHITLSALTVEGNGSGMTVYGDHHLIHGCRVANNTIRDGAFVSGENITIQYCEFEHNGPPPPDVLMHSLYLSSAHGIVFQNNEVHTATDGVKVRRTNNGVFRNNVFHGLEAIGIHLGGDYDGGTVNNRIESNLFYDNGGGIVIKSESGVQVVPVDGVVIANNIMHTPRVGFVNYGAHLVLVNDVPAQNVSVVNNLLYDMTDDNGIHIANPGSNLLCANNIVGKFTAGVAYELSSNVSATNNLEYATRESFEALNLADPADFDFTPTASSSILIDQGMDVSDLVGSDHAGNPRPAGLGHDIGPYEYSP